MFNFLVFLGVFGEALGVMKERARGNERDDNCTLVMMMGVNVDRMN